MTGRVRGLLSGGVLLGAGAVLVQTSVLGPLDAATRGDKVSYSDKALFLIPFALLLGVFILGAAALAPEWIEVQAKQPRVPFSQRSGTYKASVIAAVVFLGGAGFALRSWFLSRLAGLGYH